MIVVTTNRMDIRQAIREVVVTLVAVITGVVVIHKEVRETREAKRKSREPPPEL